MGLKADSSNHSLEYKLVYAMEETAGFSQE